MMVTRRPPNFIYAIQAYIKEVQGHAHISRSHVTLRTLYSYYGVELVDTTLDKYWKRKNGRLVER